MSKEIKKFKATQEISDIIYKFFDGKPFNITKSKIKDIYNDPNNNISEHNFKELKKIEKYIRDNKKKIILKPKKEVDKVEKVEEIENKKQIEYKDFKGEKFISYQRKAFIDFINNNFYKQQYEILNEFNKNRDKTEQLNIWQNFVKGYLGLETPYRGLLVYHGLGTGKTATAITTAEGLSENMGIFTLLPASLETNFIKEVKKWGEDLFNINNNNWIFIEELKILENNKLRKFLYEKYKITPDIIRNIYTKSKNKIKGKSLDKDKINKGIWLISNDIKKDKGNIKTISGKIVHNRKDTNKDAKILSSEEIIQLEVQIDQFIQLKYNFIHYNPFPIVESSSIPEFMNKGNKIDLDIEDDKDYNTKNKKIVKILEEKLKENQKIHYINSPFYNEVIIIDEVHNFIRQIVNDSGPSKVFYNWIINAKNIKLVCLSGTPIINRPSEIAILFNIIRGMTKRFNFSIKVNNLKNINEIYQKLKKIFYKHNSPIYQINVSLLKGKLIVSFMQNNTRFESVMNPNNNIVYTIQYQNHDFKDFMNIIYEGLHEEFEPDNIIPSKKTFEGLSEKNIIDILKGDEVEFDTDAKVKFNVYRELFTINVEEESIDLTDNENFMNYFFEGTYLIPDKKKILLKRMLMGLVSYYPINRSSIVSMPEIVIPKDNVYNDYKISKKIKIELCTMSEKQFIKYRSAWIDDKKRGNQYNKKNMYSNENFDYHINTRRICNMVYDNDKFRNMKKSKGNTEYIIEKKKEYDNLKDGSLKLNNNLNLYSPKFYSILNNISKFISFDTEISKGKILFYSDFRQDSGSEIFEIILQSNGYTKFDPNEGGKTKKLRYTFITGQEKVEERKINLDNYNHIDNIYGEYIQIIIISGAGAEGISLTGVRQVHILEPYWNFVRIEQVLGRAIRIDSHKDLPPPERNVEQYLYLSVFPEGNNINDVYKSVKKLRTWNVPDIEGDLDIETNQETFELMKKITQIKSQNINETQDQKLFNIMEKKYKISQTIFDIIKESSIDCLKNTRDDINIHQSCLQFDKKLEDEVAYYPGMSSDKLSMVDHKQLEAKFSYFIEPNIYIVSALQDDRDIFIYYRLNNTDGKETDIRYIKDNGKMIGTLDVDNQYFFLFKSDEHELDNQIGSRLSVYQEIYLISNDIITNINDNKIFSDIPELVKDLFGYKIKYNITERFYFYPIIPDKSIIRIYDYNYVEENNFNTTNMSPIIVHNKQFYSIVD